MNLKTYGYTVILFLSLLSGICACTEPWEEHYQAQDERVDMKLWDAIKGEPRFSAFTEYMEGLSMDTLFEEGTVHTLFIPSNEALAAMMDTIHDQEQALMYHISPTLFLPGNFTGERRLLNLSGKYLLISNQSGELTLDDISLISASPLYLDGKFFELEGAAVPRPNLYEYTGLFSQFLRSYIDSRDSVFLDLENSTPIGFDDQGNTVYDSVFSEVNLFEQAYFPISKEFRDQSATFILFTQDQYEGALDEMAAELGLTEGGTWVPEKWQLEELMPRLMKSAMFDGMLEYADLMQGRIPGITGDSVEVPFESIDPASRFLCSNGLTYSYLDFSIDRSLYLDGVGSEGESLIDTLGAGSWTWKEGVGASGISVSPIEASAEDASNGSTLIANFPEGYNGEFSLEFSIRNVLPLKYRLVWGANNRPSGVFEIYVNDELLVYEDKFGRTLTDFDSFLFGDTRGIRSVSGGIFKPTNSGFNKKDYWVENLNEFGDVTIRFEYVGPGSGADLGVLDGLSIDYVKLIPVI